MVLGLRSPGTGGVSVLPPLLRVDAQRNLSSAAIMRHQELAQRKVFTFEDNVTFMKGLVSIPNFPFNLHTFSRMLVAYFSVVLVVIIYHTTLSLNRHWLFYYLSF